MLDQLNQEYIDAARVKGLSDGADRSGGTPSAQHPRCSWSPIVALAYGGLLEGAVLIETVFSWPGFGQYMTNNMLTGDMNAVMALRAAGRRGLRRAQPALRPALQGLDPRTR